MFVQQSTDDSWAVLENFMKSWSLGLLGYLPCFFLDVVYSEFTIQLSMEVEQPLVDYPDENPGGPSFKKMYLTLN